MAESSLLFNDAFEFHFFFFFIISFNYVFVKMQLRIKSREEKKNLAELIKCEKGSNACGKEIGSWINKKVANSSGQIKTAINNVASHELCPFSNLFVFLVVLPLDDHRRTSRKYFRFPDENGSRFTENDFLDSFAF